MPPDLERMVEKNYIALHGDEGIGYKGLIATVEGLSEQLDKFERLVIGGVGLSTILATALKVIGVIQ